MLKEIANLHKLCFPNKSWSADDFADLKKSGCEIIASENGFIVWRCAADECEIITIGVHPDYRGQGIADAMLQLMERDITQANSMPDSPPAGESAALSCAPVGGKIIHKHQIISERIRNYASEMRQNMTPMEKKFWYAINNKKLGYKFCRQIPIDDKYIADFICYEKKLIIEIDGSQHNENKYDEKRNHYLMYEDFRILRFWNWEIENDLENCLALVYGALNNEEIDAVYGFEYEPIIKDGLIVGFDERKNKIENVKDENVKYFCPPPARKKAPPTPPQGGSLVPCIKIFLEVAENNLHALKLYERNGYKKIAVRPKYYDGKTDAIVMRKML